MAGEEGEKKSVGIREIITGAVAGAATFAIGAFATMMKLEHDKEHVSNALSSTPLEAKEVDKLIETSRALRAAKDASGDNYIKEAFLYSKVSLGATVAVSALVAVGAGWLVNKLHNRHKKSHVEQEQERKQANRSAGRSHDTIYQTR